MAAKVCAKCKTLKEASLVFFYKHRASKDGLTPRCKNCVNEDNKLSHAARMERDPGKIKRTANERSKRFYLRNLESSRKKARDYKRQEMQDPMRAEIIKTRRRGGYSKLTPEAYSNLLESQGGRCAICKTGEPKGSGFNVDHDHKTGAVRGILCGECNRGLAAYRDDITFILAAAKYMGLSTGVFTVRQIQNAAAIQHAIEPRSIDKKYKVGYDLRIDQNLTLAPKQFALASAMEYFDMPLNAVGMLFDKSSHARKGLTLFNTLINPGWRGYLTLELGNLSDEPIEFKIGDVVAQVMFLPTDEPCEPYDGIYQDQSRGPHGARYYPEG